MAQKNGRRLTCRQPLFSSPNLPGFAEELRRGKNADSKRLMASANFKIINLLYFLEGNSDTYRGVIEQLAAFNPNHLAALYPGKTALFLRQRHCSREIQLYNMARAQRGRGRQTNHNAGFADIGASAVEKPVCLRKPYAYRPGYFCSCAVALFYHLCFHT
jgi:hypothetical protein